MSSCRRPIVILLQRQNRAVVRHQFRGLQGAQVLYAFCISRAMLNELRTHVPELVEMAFFSRLQQPAHFF